MLPSDIILTIHVVYAQSVFMQACLQLLVVKKKSYQVDCKHERPHVLAFPLLQGSVARWSRPMPILVIFLTEASPPSVSQNLVPSHRKVR